MATVWLAVAIYLGVGVVVVLATPVRRTITLPARNREAERMAAVATGRAYKEHPPTSKVRAAAYHSIVGAIATFLWPWALFETICSSAFASKWAHDRAVHWSSSPAAARDYLLMHWDLAWSQGVFEHAPSASDAWRVGFAPAFRKAIVGLDKKTQGRILGALASLCDKPLEPRGDTVKPLEGALKGQWRYRIGDYRLIYRPDARDKEIVLLDFVSRGGGYS